MCSSRVVIALVLGCSLLPGRVDALRCSPVLTPQLRGERTTVLLLRPSSDSAGAGPAPFALGSNSVRREAAPPGPTRGQLMEVRRFAGHDGARIRAAFRKTGLSRVLVVPWGFDASCQPTRWRGNAVWLTPDQLVTTTLVLRPDSLWAGSTPVFDATMTGGLYVGGADVVGRDTPSPSAKPALDASEFFAALTAFPTFEATQRAPERTWRLVQAWQHAHPSLADRYPVTEMTSQLQDDIARLKEARALRRATPGMRGTYALTIQLDSLPARVVFVRTHGRANDAWRVYGDTTPGPSPLSDVPVPTALELYVAVDAGEAALPTSCETDRTVSNKAYLYEKPDRTRPGDRLARRVWLDVDDLVKPFRSDTALQAFSQQLSREYTARWIQDLSRDAPGRLWSDRGRQRVEQVMRLADGRTLRVWGERISTQVITCAY